MDKLNMSPWETPANLQAFLKPSVKVWPYSEGWIGQLTSPAMHFDGKGAGDSFWICLLKWALCLCNVQCGFAHVQCAIAMWFWNWDFAQYAMWNVLLHNVQETTTIHPHSSCVCQPASWHYHQSKAFLDLVGGAGSYCARPIFWPTKMAKLGANRTISPSQDLREPSKTAHQGQA